MTLTEILGAIPDDIFFIDAAAAKAVPNYNAVFVEIARRACGAPDNSFSIPASDILTHRLPNLSSFQRSVANERARRRPDAEKIDDSDVDSPEKA